MKEYTEKELRNKAEIYCSSAERCPSDVESKLGGWGAATEVTASVMAHLYKYKYLDNVRYCKAFVKDKYRFNQWGRIKISQSLKLKGLTSEEINEGLAEIDDEEYNDILHNLIQQKSKSVKAPSDYEKNCKLIRFAAGRGFTMQEILRHVNGDF